MPLAVKRVYEKPSRNDGKRILVDRLWPRGLSKQAAAIDLWLRDLAPSNELRKWYHGHPDAWVMFRRRYFRELRSPGAIRALDRLYEAVAENPQVTLLFASKELAHNNAVALRELLEGARKPPTGTGGLPAARKRMIRKR